MVDVFKEAEIALLAQEATNEVAWQKKHGKKTLAEELSKICGVEDLIRCGVSSDVAVDLKAKSNGEYLGTHGRAVNRLQSAPAKVRKSKVQKKSRMRVVLRKKSGEVQNLIERGGKMVVVGGKKKPTTEKPTIVFSKKKKALDTKVRTKKYYLTNGKVLKRTYCGDQIISEVYCDK